MSVFVTPGVANIICNECDAEFEVIPTNDSYSEVSFCPFCGSEVTADKEELFGEEDE